MQGVLGGLVLALVYLVGRAIMGLWWAMELPTLKARAAFLFYAALALPTLVVLGFCLQQANDWQNGIRSRMGMDLVDSSRTVQMVLTTGGIFKICFIGFLLRIAFNPLRGRLYVHSQQHQPNFLPDEPTG